MIQLKFVITTPSPYTATCKLLGYDLRGILYPAKRRIITTQVKCADSITLKAGYGEETGQAANIQAALEEADDATWPVTFYDIWGTAKTVKFLPMRATTHAKVKDRTLEQYYNLSLLEVTLE